MGVKDKVSTYIKNLGSKRDESSDIKDLEEKIKEKEQEINISTADIGEYYWNMYSKNAFIPDNQSRPMFEKIRNALREIDSLKAEIDEVKKNRNEERLNNQSNLKEKELREAKEAEERRKQKEILAREKKEREAKEAEERRKQKEAQAIAKKEREAKEAEERRALKELKFR